MSVSNRRDFLRNMAAATGAGLGVMAFPPAIRKALAIAPHRRTGSLRDVEHVVILMQENRSFDHYFGTLRGVRGHSDRFPIPVPDAPGIQGKSVWYQATGGGTPAVIAPFRLNTAQAFEYMRVEGTPHSWPDAQHAWADGKLGIEDILLAEQADTEAFYGRLSEAREFSRRAIESAQRADKRETAALWRMNEALREGEFGNFQAARQGAADAMALASTRDVQSLAALMLAQSGDVRQSQKISKDLARRHSRDTLINGYWLPSIRAAIALS